MDLDNDDAAFRLAGHGDRDVNFCSDRCLLEFEENPEVYAFAGFDDERPVPVGGAPAL
jgi:YHS domain-containing protein